MATDHAGTIQQAEPQLCPHCEAGMRMETLWIDSHSAFLDVWRCSPCHKAFAVTVNSGMIEIRILE